MENKPTVDIQAIENKFNEDLHRYLSSIGKVDERMPEAPDLEELWPKLAESYLPDGVREFAALIKNSYLCMVAVRWQWGKTNVYAQLGGLKKEFFHHLARRVFVNANEDAQRER